MPTSKTESNRDKVLRGEVVKITDDRLREMQEQARRMMGVGDTEYHWHWSAVINELIARRADETTPTEFTEQEDIQIGQVQRELAVLKKDGRSYNVRRVAGQALEIIILLQKKVIGSPEEPTPRRERIGVAALVDETYVPPPPPEKASAAISCSYCWGPHSDEDCRSCLCDKSVCAKKPNCRLDLRTKHRPENGKPEHV